MVLGDQKEIQEVKNAYKAYEEIEKIEPYSISESASESTVQPESDSDEFQLVSNDTAVDDEDDFKPVNDIDKFIEEEPEASNYIEEADDESQEENVESTIAEDVNDNTDEITSDDDGNVYFSEMAEQINDKKPKKKGKIIAVILVVLALVVAIAVGVYFYFFNGNKQDDTTTQTKPKVTETVTQKSELGPLNPLTGWLASDIISRHLTSPSMLCILSIQDWLATDEALRLPNADAERINIPANPKHYWRYRMHLNIEDLAADKRFVQNITEMISQSGRV